MTKARDLANIISGGFTVADLPTLTASEIPNLDASKITTGSIADARIPASAVSQHATSYIEWQSVVTASTLNAVAGKGYPINTTSNTCTITLPANPSVGDTIKFVDYARKFSTNKIIINQNSKNFQGSTSPNPQYDTIGQSITCTYIDDTQGWLPTVDDDVSFETSQDYSLQYLVIAGGGAGGGGHRAGGGGAGGYRNSYASETSGRNSSTETPWTVNPGTVVTVTVGAGGAVASQANGGTGGTSSISASGQTTITSNGGGGGGEYEASADAGTYGSGGGSGHRTNNSSMTGSDGTAGQGFDGGDIAVSNSIPQGGAGGGAGANGDNGGNTSATTGGTGLSSSITGSAITRGGGGGAGSYGSGGKSNGGAGGGGNGGHDSSTDTSGVADGTGSYYYPVAGTDNTGGGGGGTAGPNNTTTYGRGGTGVVILRVPTANYSGTTTGSPTVSTVGSDKVLIFNSSGSYTT